jgi:hypothetical protein
VSSPFRKAVPVLATVITGLLAGTVPARATDVRREDPVCNAMHTFSVPADESVRAAQIMSGTVELGSYGTMRLDRNPTWADQPTLDLAGNRYQNSLHWALPLLREGTRPGPQAPAMTARFVQLLRDWVADHPVSRRGGWIDHPQYGGFRLGTWVCAQRLLTDPGQRAWVAAQERIDLSVQLKRFNTIGANNTMLNSQLAALAAAEDVGTPAQRNQALRNIDTLQPLLVNADGSDLEGAPGYGSYLSQILIRTERVLTAYQAVPLAIVVRENADREGDFLAQASRPDRYIESIGDGYLRRISSGVFAPDTAATWVLSSGRQGVKPARTYSRWQGGYVFGRSAWIKGPDESSSFYSLRTSTVAPATAHRHLDTTGVTFYSHGVSWIGDPGPYRYDTSALRRFITRRAAHSALIAAAPMTATAPGILIPGSPSKKADKTCVRDLAYESTAGIGLTRCVYYLRTIDVLVVQDVVTATRDAATVTQQWVLPPAVESVQVQPAGGFRLTGTTGTGLPRTAILLTSGAAQVKPAGPVLGQFGTSYGVRKPGTVISLPIKVLPGGTQQSLTALAPGDRPLTLTSRPTVDGRTALTVTAGTDRQAFVLAR